MVGVPCKTFWPLMLGIQHQCSKCFTWDFWVLYFKILFLFFRVFLDIWEKTSCKSSSILHLWRCQRSNYHARGRFSLGNIVQSFCLHHCICASWVNFANLNCICATVLDRGASTLYESLASEWLLGFDPPWILMIVTSWPLKVQSIRHGSLW